MKEIDSKVIQIRSHTGKSFIHLKYLSIKHFVVLYNEWIIILVDDRVKTSVLCNSSSVIRTVSSIFNCKNLMFSMFSFVHILVAFQITCLMFFIFPLDSR